MLLMTIVSSVATIGLISAYLLALLQLPAEQWRGFGEIVAGLFLILLVVTPLVNRRLFEGVLEHLVAVEEGRATREGVREAFRAQSRLPYAMFLSGIGWWTVGGLIVATSMWLRYESFQFFAFTVMTMAAASGGFVSSTFQYFGQKRSFRDLLVELATQIDDPIERRELVHPVTTRAKLLVSITGVTFVTVTFAMCLAFVTSSRQLEANLMRTQAGFLDQAVDSLEEATAVPEALQQQARSLAVASQLIIVAPNDPDSLEAAAQWLFPEELSLVRVGGDRGGGEGFDSPNVFSWRRIGESEHILVAMQPWTSFAHDSTPVQILFAVILAASAGISVGLSRVLARDVGDSTRALRDEVDRMAAGDLRRHNVLESEDELGDLARSFEVMASSVGQTVSRVAAAADRAEAASSEIRVASRRVATGAEEQGRGVEEAARLMEGIEGQVSGVAGNARELNLLVEESSSSILEMGVAGEQLNDTARVLSTKVDEVSSSIEEMVRSVKEVVGNTEELSDAATETSSSMEEMASAMRHVDTVAEQTEVLSRQAVESAETGREKVRQTIEGMESIRSATETAETVIRNLGSRALEIGAILDVIDDVADETNLLALNAAIIAAQAGEHGRAFSVVADEIKELADRVLASTKEIGGLIRAVQDESKSAIGAIEDGSRSVASGVELSMSAGASLEEITRSSRDSGGRMLEIVQAVREQTKAAGHVVGLMERVRTGVESIQRAAGEQDRGNEVVYRSSEAMREMATQLRGTTEEQARGGARVRESIDGVRDAVEGINGALQSQTSSNAELSSFLVEVSNRAADNTVAAQGMDESTRELASEAEAMREEVGKFEV